jgi:hypothetical protein
MNEEMEKPLTASPISAMRSSIAVSSSGTAKIPQIEGSSIAYRSNDIIAQDHVIVENRITYIQHITAASSKTFEVFQHLRLRTLLRPWPTAAFKLPMFWISNKADLSRPSHQYFMPTKRRSVYDIYKSAISHGKMNDVTVQTQQYLLVVAVAHGVMKCRHGNETL